MPESRVISGVVKLIPNLYDKEKYVVHIATLDLALKHGLTLDKVHRVIEFDETTWLRSHIDFNTELQTKAKKTLRKTSLSL